ncbi:mechanosensitive ion channel protein MscS [Longibacter salinarum]|uniref:Mechanosensitive ion channel protein MscS n=1 Tax=Longibacter salinarum TaxID=1850348 RepID=A0A2A8CTP7_9BACT|nr:mechanosensitive ion channel family protein [Longibacter salinarum]PEN11068.1 mechanosensitive ion channel protein MscS [Longibacter salinarum]
MQLSDLFSSESPPPELSPLEVLGVMAGAALLGYVANLLMRRIIRVVTRRVNMELPLRGVLLRHIRGPMRLLMPTIGVLISIPTVRDSLGEYTPWVEGILQVLFLGAATWLILELLHAAEEAIAEHYATDVPDNLKARKIVTQMRILRRIVSTVIVVIAAALVLLQYEPFREVGAGILASAGVFGIIFGIAAQRTLGNLVAGIQIAFTQPIRVDDVVVVQGDFGWVEEITLTYVVVRVWDKRRIVLPITHFVEEPFQNWTRTSSDLLGTVYLYVDHTTPIDAVREELGRVVEASEHWDGEVWRLHVTETTEKTIELRCLASAESAPVLWELRCEIREKMVAYLQREFPDALPTVRARLDGQPYGEMTSAPLQN